MSDHKKTRRHDLALSVTRFESGYVLIRKSAESWCQLPYWPCTDYEVVYAHTFNPKWNERFIREVLVLAEETR